MFKSIGALNFFYFKKSDITGRTVTIWPNLGIADKVFEKMRASAGNDTGGTITARSKAKVMGSTGLL